MKKKEKKPIVMHQHVDDRGVVCGKAHPIEALHWNLKTRLRHNKTMAGDPFTDDMKYMQKL